MITPFKEKDFFMLAEDMQILELAVDCLFINDNQKTKVLDRLNKDPQSKMSVQKMLAQDFKLSSKKIEYLTQLNDYLSVHRKDWQFGRLATANGICSEKEIARALAYQKSCFRKSGSCSKIGDILVDTRIMSRSDLFSILLTQNRIKDEYLFEAVSRLGKTREETKAINMRFGAIAIKKQWVTREQVHQALDQQKKNIKAGHEPCFIGQILLDAQQITPTQILDILSEQKYYEKKRLDLERALYSVKEEIKISEKLNRVFKYEISRDGLEARVKKCREIKDDILIYEMRIWLRRAGIKFGIVNDPIFDAFIQNSEKNAVAIVAKGLAPIQGSGEKIKLNFNPDINEGADTSCDPGIENTDDPQEKTDDTKENKDARKKNAPLKQGEQNDPEEPCIHLGSVHAGEILAQVIPAQNGRPGKNVFGNIIQPDPLLSCEVNSGAWVTRKGYDFIARTKGRPFLKAGKTICIEPESNEQPIQTLTGKISTDTQETYIDAAVKINGDLTCDAILRCRELILKGSLMGRVICAGDMEVKGPIGTPSSSRDTSVLPLTDILCHGTLHASETITNATVCTGKRLFAINSTVVGSEISAYEGMTIKDALSGEQPSILRFGLEPEDTLFIVDKQMDTLNAQLSALKKERAIDNLKKNYAADLKSCEQHLREQALFKSLIRIIEGPELYQHSRLENKITYLQGLPEFSSIKKYYLTQPKTKESFLLIDEIIRTTQKMSLDKTKQLIQTKIDPVPETPETLSAIERLRIEFEARLNGLENERDAQADEIFKLKEELLKLGVLKKEMNSNRAKTGSPVFATIKIKNKCQKGTIIKGRYAQMTMEKTQYRVLFKEVVDPKTNQESIVIETC